MDNKKLKYTELIPKDTVGIVKQGLPTVAPTSAPVATASSPMSYSSIGKDDGLKSAPRTDAFKTVGMYNQQEQQQQQELEQEQEQMTTVPKMSYEEWYNTAKQNAESTRQYAIGNAENDYIKSKSEYGNRAEALRGMGLTGAGYSDYLNGQAYAQMQGAKSNANAQYNQTIADIDAKYMDYLEQKEQQRLALLETLDYGGYTVKQLDRYLEQGLITKEESDAYKKSLENKALNLTTVDLDGYTREEVKSLMDSLSDAGYTDAKNHVQKLYDNKYNIKWNAGGGGAFVDNVNGKNTYAVGDKITIKAQTITSGDGNMETREFNVKIKAEVTDPSVIEAATQAANGQAFKFGDQIYLKINDTVYSLEKKDYDQLNKLFK